MSMIELALWGFLSGVLVALVMIAVLVHLTKRQVHRDFDRYD